MPYFNSISTKQDVLTLIDAKRLHLQPLGKLIVYGELKLVEKVKAEYDRMFEEKLNPHFLETVKEYGEKYGISLSHS